MSVNVNASNASLRRNEVIIDLTGDDDDDDGDVPSRNQPDVQSTERYSGQHPSSTNGHHSKAKGNGPSITSITSTAQGASMRASTSNRTEPGLSIRPSSQQNQHSPSLPSPFSSQAQEHPTKRRKTHHSTSHKPAVFPHLEVATKRLDQNVYDVEKLGGRIIGRIANKEFERHFRDGNGKLASDIEAYLIVQIHQLVTEFTAGNEFRREPAAPVVATPVPVPKLPGLQTPIVVPVLPSIENPRNEPPLDRGDGPGESGGRESLRDVSRLKERHNSQQIQTPSRVPLKKKPPLLPQQQQQQQQTKPNVIQWQSGKSCEFKGDKSPVQMKNPWFGLSSRPYLPAKERRLIMAGVGRRRGIHLENDQLRKPTVYHVGFSDEEVKYISLVARKVYGRPARGERSESEDLRRVMKKFGVNALVPRIVDAHRQGYTDFSQPPQSLLQRSADDTHNFLQDLFHRQAEDGRRMLFLERADDNAPYKPSSTYTLSSLLLAREIVGNHLGATRRYLNFNVAFRCMREDDFEPRIEWTNCAGDIMTIAWAPDSNTFVCGTTTHSDSHNQQYNKPGNLLFGSVADQTLRAFDDHRIPRPVVEHGENSLQSMRESQDPWLYTSVVSSDYDPRTGWLFTSSFDHTVKVWSPTKTHISGITLVHKWQHEGRVNFVVTNKCDGISKVATAADVPENAVRVYHPHSHQDIPGYDYTEFTCKRVHGEDYVPSDKWAYFPSAIRWGIEQSVNHLLLVGYSPRSFNGDDNDIPEEKQKTGELCLWDTNTNTEVKVNSAATSNVFEVAWHPYRPSFAVATSASLSSEKIEEHIRTQIRLFEPNETGQYGVVKTLDCPAIDINEIAIRPNSVLYSYIAAGCTDGKVYIWDSARSEDDDPICVLKHGDPVEEILGDREEEDVGVKFVSWATTIDRLYTGSSDGVVKVWNIRHGKGDLVRNLIEVPAPITAGAFSPDFDKLLIGDGSGRVYLLDVNGEEEDDEDEQNQRNPAGSSNFLNLQLNGQKRAIRRPRPFIPHPTPAPPIAEGQMDYDSEAQIGQERAKAYLNKGQMIIHPDPTIGAVQGPFYAETNLFRAEAHLDGNPEAPLLATFEAQQRENQVFSRRTRFKKLKEGKLELSGAAMAAHWENLSRDFEAALDEDTRGALESERAEIEFDGRDLDYESD
ncbi:hypothetical protein ABKA04_002967 [Annulohypoxylon sp. FPYF3050]